MLSQVMDDLFQSVSIEKGIEKTINFLEKTYKVDYVALMRYVEEIADYHVEYEEFRKPGHMEAFSLNKFLQFWKEQYHFQERDCFWEMDLSNLSMEERAFYATYSIGGVAEFELRTQGDTIGYFVMYWGEDSEKPGTDQLENIHLIAKLLGEAVFREFLADQMDDSLTVGDYILDQMKETSVYAINEEYRLLYMNETLKKNCPGAQLGKVCYECIMLRHEPCRDCMSRRLKDGQSCGSVVYNPIIGKQLHIFMTRTKLYDETAYILACFDYIGNQGEENAKTIYRLATALQYAYHCVLEVNFNKNAYVDITRGEHFGVNNRNYIKDFSVKHPEKVFDKDRDAFEHFFEEDNIRRMYLRGEKDAVIEFRAHTGDYVYRWFSVTVLFMDTLPGRDFICFYCYRDIDELKKRELLKEKELNTALVTARSASEAQSNFLANISHEIRTPMNGIIGMTSLARDVVADEGRVLDCLHNIDVSSRHLMSVINDIMDITQLEEGHLELKREKFNLEKLLDNIDILNRQEVERKCMRFVLTKDFQENHFIGDKYRLQQVLTKLLSNALKYTPKGGEIELKAQKVTRDDTNVIMCFSVRDTGIGMSSRSREKVLDAFHQASGVYNGTGMGLSICSSIVEMMGGDLKVESEEGKGSEFYFTIPLEIDEDRFEEISDGVLDFKLLKVEGLRALVVEDNDVNAKMMRTLLTRSGFEVEMADDGKEAVIQFVSHPSGYYDLILMDIQMPVMDGYDASRCIRLSGKDDAETIPIIALTANAISEYREKALEAGMNAFIMKPIEFKEFFSVLSELV